MEPAGDLFGGSYGVDDICLLAAELEAAIALCNLKNTVNPPVPINEEVARDAPTGRNQKNTVLDELDELDAMCVALFGDREDSGAEFVDAALDSHFRSGGGALSESVLRDELLARIIFDVLAFDFGPGECKGTTLLNATCPRNSDS
jgi:hypothetical protein